MYCLAKVWSGKKCCQGHDVDHFSIAESKPPGAISKMGGQTETFTEGAWPAPDGGLTAEVRVFSAGGAARTAFCDPPGIASVDWDYGTIFNAARGNTGEALLGVDVVAGVDEVVLSGNDNFVVRNIPGFDRLGGSALTDQSNYIVHYFGALTHNSGTLWARERDDCAERHGEIAAPLACPAPFE